MATLRRIKLNGLNAHITCTLCQGYYVEATTIIECLHTFCRTCIVRYLETSTFCPVCEVQVHKTKPLLSLREDKTLQDVVYKLVPNLYRNEMQRRTKFYIQHPKAGGDRTEQSLKEKRHFFHVDDQISLSLEFLPPAHAHAHALGLRPLRGPTLLDNKDFSENEGLNDSQFGIKVPHKRFIRCQAAVQIRLLEKFIRLKYSLSDAHRVDIVHGSDCLSPELTLLDVVYTYKYTEDCPLNLQYTVIAPPPTLKRKRLKQSSKPSTVSDSDCKLKRQKLDIALNNLEIKRVTPSMEMDDNQNPLTDTYSVNKEECDNMVIDIPLTDNKLVTHDDGKENNKTIKQSESSEEESSKPVATVIESLKKFVNNAPGLSGFPLNSTKSNITTIKTENDTPNNKKINISSNTETNSVVTTEVNNISKVSECSVAAPIVTVSYVSSSSVTTTNVTSVINSAVRPTVLPNTSLQTNGAVRHPQVSSPRVVLHRPSNVGFPQSNNLVRFNNGISDPRPVDPSKPRLGRPPNAARVAAAAAGRVILQPILPRGPPARIQFTPNKPIIPGKIENRTRLKKKSLAKKISVTNIVSSPILSNNTQMRPCVPINGNVSMNSKEMSNKIHLLPHEACTSSNSITTSSSSNSVGTKINTNVVNSISVGNSLVSSPKSAGSVASKHLNVPNKPKGMVNKPAVSRLSSITDILVNKQLSQLKSPKTSSENSNSLPVPATLPTVPTPVTTPSMLSQLCPGLPFLPTVNPALCAAYMSDYTNNVNNWIKFTQTAAAFRDMNLQALANQRAGSPNKNDAKPMDLSPTNKNICVSTSSQPSLPAVTNPYNPNAMANIFPSSQTSTIDYKTINSPLLKSKVSEKGSKSLDKLINTKFNNNNNISIANSAQHARKKSPLKSVKAVHNNYSNKIDSALNNSQIMKCTSYNQSKMSKNQVPFKSIDSLPRINGMTTSGKLNGCDKNMCSGAPVNSKVNSTKTVNSVNYKVPNNSVSDPQRSSPIPAVTPTERSIRSEGLHSVPSPKAAQSASPDSPSIPSVTISPPTAEVTITKLPNSSVSSSISYVVPAPLNAISTSIGKITHTNTVSITKRPSASIVSVANKLAVRAPNASIRQIPNPSLLSQKSEVRNNNVRVDN